ncbi:MAG: quinolinate synthase NadA, partial [Actinobacteria bacterium]|nr:quinolinate synthase NadA [Actinomycetota bacterium]
MNELQKKIVAMKEDKNAIILAHYYTIDEVQELADFVGDSYYLAKIASSLEAETIVLCGVSFMGESVKVLNPGKTVMIPEPEARCPMAYMVTSQEIERMRTTYDDLAVVCYINSTAEIKAHSDVCVTSSNALEIVKSLPQRTIFFVPDENLGSYIAEKIPEKDFVFNGGYCHVHTAITEELVQRAMERHPNAEILAHPECKPDVLALADYIGSTSGIIEHATRSECNE